MKIIHSPSAPKAIGPYSQAVEHAGIIYCSGQIGLNPETMEFAGTDVATQAAQVMKNLGEVLKAGGSGYSKVLKCTIFLADMGDFVTVNEIYGRYFGDHKPARETVAVKTLPKNALVEIGCVAVGG